MVRGESVINEQDLPIHAQIFYFDECRMFLSKIILESSYNKQTI